MNITNITIGELPPEIGPAGERLVVLAENGRYETILIKQPMTTHQLADQLENLAQQLRDIKWT